ncbi:phosphomannomutase/phosphoglucomutase [Corynebacterium sp. TAE3-ERU12]|uniref:phosphomannomutase/phosphoglucomutase n=1 Tax=Corynebacterium sp. TAE3-ERU12 TaxID=2849491 RepID=UPI001C45A09B|nr:phosphomannomutase/phosphoglucomutase [Corynebacterium sp. TAE3-ERU12]MBV7294810.1 phosphomannomutase/phosphoglucomutase [Corynebacterium sp. TAE3-ERU12]
MTTRSRSEIDAIIKAYDIRGVVGEGLDAQFAEDAGAAFGHLIAQDNAESAVIAHDMRDSSPELATAFAKGVTSRGLDVVFIGLASTDELYYASGELNMPGAMFTASHNPAKYNGIKLCRALATPIGQDTGLGDIADMLVDGVPAVADDVQPGEITHRDMLSGYAEFLHGLAPVTGRKLTVAVDAGNGMAGLTAPAVLGDITDLRELYFELDGNFPNHEANPLEPKNLEDLQKFTVDQGADIGIAFDGDADRCFVVDELGKPVSPSAICALIAERSLIDDPGATIIHNLITSAAVPELIAELGGIAVRTRVGHSFIKAQMASTHAVFGGEHSAHYYFRDFFNADSGMLAALHVLAALAETDVPLSQLKAKYDVYVQSGEINSRLDSAEQQKERQEAVAQAFVDRTRSIDYLDGLTIGVADSKAWFNVRASNTEPLLRLNVEAETAEDMAALRDEILGIIRA